MKNLFVWGAVTLMTTVPVSVLADEAACDPHSATQETAVEYVRGNAIELEAEQGEPDISSGQQMIYFVYLDPETGEEIVLDADQVQDAQKVFEFSQEDGLQVSIVGMSETIQESEETYKVTVDDGKITYTKE